MSDAQIPVAVSLNGNDNVGKTTQLSWLHRGIPAAHLTGTADSWEPRWKQVAAGDFAHWWFVASTTEEHVALMLAGHAARRAASAPVALEDRGLPMIRAACAATAVVKEGLRPAEALQRVERLTADQAAADQRREVHVLLRRFSDPAREAAAALAREPSPPNKRYAAYQHALAEIVAIQADRGEYHVVLDIGDASILDVQRQLRAWLIDAGLAVQPLPRATIDRLWVLGGLSESGKTTVGELLRDEHGVTRLKIGYLIQLAALRAGVDDPYERWTEPEQAERLSEEILQFSDANKARVISLESAHRFEATAHLKRVWGAPCRVIYVDAPASVRLSRAFEPEQQLQRRDVIKRERGADQIAEIADEVIDNSGPYSALKLAVARTVLTADIPRSAPTPTTPTTQGEVIRQVADHILDEQVTLVLATGTTGTSAWRGGWSDLDLLVVRDAAPASWLAGVIGTVPKPEGLKTSISVFTTGDIDALRVPPRVVQSLRRAARGIGVIHRRADYELPVPFRPRGSHQPGRAGVGHHDHATPTRRA